MPRDNSVADLPGVITSTTHDVPQLVVSAPSQPRIAIEPTDWTALHPTHRSPSSGPLPPLLPPLTAGVKQTADNQSPQSDHLPVPESGRTSRLSTATVAAPVQCVCVFVARTAGRHCREGRRRAGCDFAAEKTVGYCGFPAVLLAWGAFWALLILGVGGVLQTRT
ncbi:uncharacterized protein LOC119094501 [Pollicipes pollicipes]|uniref:uncharacterized protein LOC119094501 n=1 Tax=Pollicipes pollicipes TaxID=41117 RepID=UPI001885345F|nr:uncharacterized protein LOC119094501 [Pollicipes pollicipes]